MEVNLAYIGSASVSSHTAAFYRVGLTNLHTAFTARCYAERGYATVCHLSVRPSIRLSVCDVEVP